MPVSHESLEKAFNDALVHVKAAVTPNDGGLTETALQVLRNMLFEDPNVQKQFNDKLQSAVTEKQKVIAAKREVVQSAVPAPPQQTVEVQPAKSAKAQQPLVQAAPGTAAGSQQGDHAPANSAPGTEGGAGK